MTRRLIALVAFLALVTSLAITSLAISAAAAVPGDVTSVAGGGSSTAGGIPAPMEALAGPTSVAFDAEGNRLVADPSDSRVQVVAVSASNPGYVLSGCTATCVWAVGDIYTIAGTGTAGYSGDRMPAGSAQLDFPFGISVDAAGNPIVADTGNNRVRVVAVSASNPGYRLAACTGTCVWTVGDIYTIAGTGTGGYNGDGIAATQARLNEPWSRVAVDASGDLLIADSSNNRIRVVAESASNPGYRLAGCAATCVWTVGDIYTIAKTNTTLVFPESVAVDASGNPLVADTSNARVRVVAVSASNPGYRLAACTGTCVWTVGNIYTIAGTSAAGYNGDGITATTARVGYPEGVAVDAAGNPLVADTANSRVRVVAVSASNPGYLLAGCAATCAWTVGNIYTVAGTGVGGYNGDAMAATAAQLDQPAGVAVDAVGDIDVADTGNARVREVAVAASVTVVPSALPADPGPVTYTVDVAGAGPTPTGSVTVSDDQGGSCIVDALATGAGSCDIVESATASPYTVTAAYSGDTNYAPEATSVSVGGAVSSGGTASVGANGVTVTGLGGVDGTDTVTETAYPSDPVGTSELVASGPFFGLALSPGNAFTSATIVDCNLGGGDTPRWWNPAANGGAGMWVAVVGDPGPGYTPGAPPCLSMTLDSSTAPSLAALDGTLFGVIKTVPGAPTSVSASPGNAAATVRWTAPASDGGSPITGYVVTPYLGGTAQAGRSFATTATTEVITGLTNARSYAFKVAASNAARTGPASPSSTAIVVGTPVAPTGVKALSGSTTTTTGSLVVSYAAGANNGATITSYKATCTSTNGGASVSGSHTGATAAPITVTGATTAKSYRCTVAATNARGLGPAASAAPAVIVGAPRAPTGVGATEVAAQSLKVTFTPGANDGATITGFTATCTSSNGGVTKSASETASPLTVTGLTTGATYSCSVSAANSRGRGPASSASAAVTL